MNEVPHGAIHKQKARSNQAVAGTKEVEKSFKPGMKLFNGHGKCFPVLKVTAKRVVLQGYSYNNGYPRKSEWRDNLARWIVNGSWTLQES